MSGGKLFLYVGYGTAFSGTKSVELENVSKLVLSNPLGLPIFKTHSKFKKSLILYFLYPLSFQFLSLLNF